jgi:peptide/nickel transport system permease protein
MSVLNERWREVARTLRRTAWQAIPTVLGVVVLNFFLMQLVPGDAADVVALHLRSHNQP